jgi:hypothetical protein
LDFYDGMRRRILNDADALNRMNPIVNFVHSTLYGDNIFGSNNTNKGILGSDLAFIPETLAGGGGGLGFSGTALRGSNLARTSFSHMWPRRWGGPLTIFNGRVVPNAQHAAHDVSYFVRGQAGADKLNPVLKFLDRIPPIYRGALSFPVGGSVLGGECRKD